MAEDREPLDRQYEDVNLYRLEFPDTETLYVIAGNMLQALRKYEAHMLSRDLAFEDPEEILLCCAQTEVIA